MSLLCVFTVLLCAVSVYAHSQVYNEVQDMKNLFASRISDNIPTGYFASDRPDTVSQIPVAKSSSVFNISNEADPIIGNTLSLFDASKDLNSTDIVKPTNGSVYANPDFGGLITSFRVKLIKYSDGWSRDKMFPPKKLQCDVSVLSDFRKFDRNETSEYGDLEIPDYTILSYKCSQLSDTIEAALWWSKQVSEKKKESYSLYSLHKYSESYKEGNSTVFSLYKVILSLSGNEVNYIECRTVEIVRDDTIKDNELAYRAESANCYEYS